MHGFALTFLHLLVLRSVLASFAAPAPLTIMIEESPPASTGAAAVLPTQPAEIAAPKATRLSAAIVAGSALDPRAGATPAEGIASVASSPGENDLAGASLVRRHRPREDQAQLQSAIFADGHVEMGWVTHEPPKVTAQMRRESRPAASQLASRPTKDIGSDSLQPEPQRRATSFVEVVEDAGDMQAAFAAESDSVSARASPGTAAVQQRQSATTKTRMLPVGPLPADSTARKAFERVKSNALFPVVLCFVFMLLMVLAMSVALMGHKGQAGESHCEKPIPLEPDPLTQDLHGLAITSLVRDMNRAVAGSEALYVRTSRMGVTLVVLIFSMVLQVYLLVQMKTLVTSEAVAEIRSLYDKYEVVMYGSNTSRMEHTPNGYKRGIAQYYDPQNFAKLSEEEKDEACRVPLSQPTFFMTILLIWTFIIIADIRKVVSLGLCLVHKTPTIETMEHAIQPIGDESDQKVLIAGLTRFMKASLACLLFIPRLVVDIVLLWLGCRLLTATLSFSDLLLDAVALEFVLNIHGIIFAAMVPRRNQLETYRTHVMPMSDESPVSAWAFLSTYLWGFAGIFWVLMYMYGLQSVLPDFRWDIQDACSVYLAHLTKTHA